MKLCLYISYCNFSKKYLEESLLISLLIFVCEKAVMHNIILT